MADAPDFLTVVETAKVLRIRRTAAYQLVNHDLVSGGGDGLRARRFGRSIRVPRAALEELMGAPITWPLGDASAAHARDQHPTAAPLAVESASTPRRIRRQPQRQRDDAQLKLIANDD